MAIKNEFNLTAKLPILINSNHEMIVKPIRSKYNSVLTSQDFTKKYYLFLTLALIFIFYIQNTRIYAFHAKIIYLRPRFHHLNNIFIHKRYHSKCPSQAGIIISNIQKKKASSLFQGKSTSEK